MYKRRKRSASPPSSSSRRAPTSRRHDDDSSSRGRRGEGSRRTRPESDYYRPDSSRRHRQEADHIKSDRDNPKDKDRVAAVGVGTIQVTFDDRSGKKVTLACLPSDDIGSVKKKVAEVIGTKANKFVLKRGAQTFKDQGSLDLYEVHNKTSVEILYT